MADCKLWYSQSTRDWNEALPIGNGSLGGMVFGGVEKELIQMNEESLWYGGYRDRHNEDAKQYLPIIRELLFKGEIREAEKLLSMSMFATPDSQSHYSVLGDLVIQFYHSQGEVKDYRRELDLETALARVDYTIGETKYERTYFCSYPDKVMVAHFKGSKPGGIELSTYLDRKGHVDEVEMGTNHMTLYGRSGYPSGVTYSFEMSVQAEGGSISRIGQRLYVKDADSVTIKVVATTSFKVENPKKETDEQLEHLKGKGYVRLLQRHLEDYQPLIAAMSINLMGEDYGAVPTDERLQRFRSGEEDLDLVSLYFQYGRYLLLSSSRKGCLPANLQGIWNKEWQPAWGSKYTININTEMNYWLAEKGHLSECHLPLFDHLERMKPRGEITAQKMYGCNGWVAHHNTDLWGDTAPQDRWMPGTIWPMSGAWLCLHIWEHYEYTRDLVFLRDKYHLMKGAGDFFKEYLIRDEKGYLVTGPSTSPENTYILPSGESGTVCIGPTMDNEILYELFTALIKAGKLVGECEEEIEQFKVMRSQLTPLQIGRHGQIMEWREDYEELEPGHRHISHLFGLYPGSQISMNLTPELGKAAKVTLERRLAQGGGHTGWSRAWIINLWARLKEGELAYENVRQLLIKSTLNNLLDNHPPFQIDGNFGGAAGITEMLLQEEEGCIELLPALPKAWVNGQVKGMCIKGGLIIDFAWKDGRISSVLIKAKESGRYKIRTMHPLVGQDHQSSVFTAEASMPYDLVLEMCEGKGYQLGVKEV